MNFESTNANITDRYYVKGEKRGYYGNDLLKHALHNTVPDITKTVQDDEGNDIRYVMPRPSSLPTPKSMKYGRLSLAG